MTSLKVIKDGAQVFDSYGKKCNSKFLLHYGFTIESNREVRGLLPPVAFLVVGSLLFVVIHSAPPPWWSVHAAHCDIARILIMCRVTASVKTSSN